MSFGRALSSGTQRAELAITFVIHWHDSQLSRCTEPADRWLPMFRDPGEHLKIVSLAFDEVFKHLALLVRAMDRDNVLLFSQSDLLGSLLHSIGR